ncbi:MAG: metal ABC transporter solute-binding protein, Zn/Mn family [Microthrixaceae bacterium]
MSTIVTLAGVATLVGVSGWLAVGCGSGRDGAADGPNDPARGQGNVADVVVTTSVMGDVVSNLLGQDTRVETIMAPGADPHDFAPSARQIDSMMQADVLVSSGGGFEEGLEGAIEQAEAERTPLCTAIDYVDTIGSDGVDPHFFTDPSGMAAAAEGLTDCILAAVPALDTEANRAHADAYIAQLTELDAEVAQIVARVPAQRRVLVTNHGVFGYFAQRYGFEVAGSILPRTTGGDVDASALEELAGLIRDEDVPAVFVDASSSGQLADALASEVGGVEVVELFSESLGPDGGETYLDMVRTNAQRIAEALS